MTWQIALQYLNSEMAPPQTLTNKNVSQLCHVLVEDPEKTYVCRYDNSRSRYAWELLCQSLHTVLNFSGSRLQEEHNASDNFKMSWWDFTQSTVKLRLFVLQVNRLGKNKFSSIYRYPCLYLHIDHRKKKTRQIDKVNDRKLSINRFCSFSTNCLNSTNLVQ